MTDHPTDAAVAGARPPAAGTFPGACACGAVRFTARAPSRWVVHCHCHDCRRAHAAPLVTWACFADDDLALDAGSAAPTWHASSPGAQRAFCPACGTPLLFRARRWPGEVHVARAAFPGTLDRAPGEHVHFASRVPWLDVRDALPRHASNEAPDQRPPGPAVPHLRPAVTEDAACLSALAIQVFLDTYATQGLRPALAREALGSFSTATFERALADPHTRLVLAECAGHVVGFAHVTLGQAHALAPPGAPAEVLRLYVQERFTGRRVGTALLDAAERVAAGEGAAVLWLTPWVGNARALAFYAARGYTDHGLTHFRLEGETHENRLLAKQLDRTVGADRWPRTAAPPARPDRA